MLSNTSLSTERSRKKRKSAKYNRTLQEIETASVKWWPDYLKKIEAEQSIMPLLLETQDKFISILTLYDNGNPESILDIIDSANFPANLFIKHLMVLSDFGSEPLQRVHCDFNSIFPNGNFMFVLDGKKYQYKFQSLPIGQLTNKTMRTDNVGLRSKEPITDFYKDLVMLLLYAGNDIDSDRANTFSSCIVGNILGSKKELENFIKQRYIYVSRIVKGAQSNDIGNAAQNYVLEYIKTHLGDGYAFGNHIPDVTQNNGRTDTSFDIVVSKQGKYVAIEVSFQVTTNSVIERKGGQARERFSTICKTGNYIAYIIDGAGNFQRKSAITTICENSHCTVAYSDSEFDLLIRFIKEVIG